MPSTESIRDAIRKHFGFLLEHGFTEVEPCPQTDDGYAEMNFAKSNWRIAVLTTSHGTKITLHIISPDGRRGFLSHLGNSKSESDVMSEIQSKAKFLQKNGLSLLQGNASDFQSVFEAVTEKHQQWIKKTGITGQQLF